MTKTVNEQLTRLTADLQIPAAVSDLITSEIEADPLHGNVGLKLSGFSDANCDANTIAGGPGEAEVEPGGEATYTCTRLLGAPGTYTNVATVTGTPPHEAPLTLPSNTVEAVVPAVLAPGKGGSGVGSNEEAPTQKVGGRCESSRPALHGGAGRQTGSFTMSLRSAGVARVTFYLDGHKLRTFTQAQARGGKFKLAINARKLSYGVHHLSFQVAMINKLCASSASARMFFRPRPIPPFTG